MKTFKEYLSEEPRTIERAARLGTKVAAIHAKKFTKSFDGDDHPFIKINSFSEEEHGEVTDKYYRLCNKMGHLHHLPYAEEHKNFPSKDLHPMQDEVSFDPKFYKDHKADDNTPILSVVHKGKHYIIDGHHRWFSNRLKRIPSHVISFNMDRFK